MNYIIADLEATTWEGNTDIEKMETIEIGAVKLDGDEFKTLGEFSSFVRPVASAILSEFCRELTTIKQGDVDAADYFPTVFKKFLDWVGDEPYKFCTWSTYDLKQFKRDCARHHITFPDALGSHIDLQQLFGAKENVEPCGMEAALARLGLPLEGIHHRALDDTRNIAKIAIDLFKNKRGDNVHVEEYNPGWPKEFISERDKIRALLGDEIRAIEHVGSTALPGVAAKPTIDLMIGVYMLDVSETIISALKSLGYNYFGEYGIPGRHFFRKGKPPTHHIHWVETQSDFWETQLLFRDYMRSHPEDAKVYVSLKKDLAEKYREDRDKYTVAKSEFILGINEKARAWKKAQES